MGRYVSFLLLFSKMEETLWIITSKSRKPGFPYLRRYTRRTAIRNQTFFYDALDTEELNGSEMFQDPDAQSVEDAAERNILLEKLRDSVGRLSDDEKELLSRLYVYGESLRRVAGTTGIPLTTLHGRHRRLLKKLKNFLEN